jgi:glycerophosphoryl diester phosphodiesterase
MRRIRTVAAAAATVFILSLLLILSSCASTESRLSAAPIAKVAHRGGSLLAPENTLAAFQRGIDEGADAIELDVHLSADGQLIVMHDPSLFRTTAHEGYIGDWIALDLQSLDASASYRGDTAYPVQHVPTLEQVLALVERQERSVALQVEIKTDQKGRRYEGIEEAVVSALRLHGLIEETIIISFDFPTLLRIREIEPSLKLGALVNRAYLESIGMAGPAAVAASIADLGVEYVAINYAYLSQRLFDEFRSHNLLIGAWTVNNEKDIRRIAAMGVDFITSDRPDLLRELLD